MNESERAQMEDAAKAFDMDLESFCSLRSQYIHERICNERKQWYKSKKKVQSKWKQRFKYNESQLQRTLELARQFSMPPGFVWKFIHGDCAKDAVLSQLLKSYDGYSDKGATDTARTAEKLVESLFRSSQIGFKTEIEQRGHSSSLIPTPDILLNEPMDYCGMNIHWIEVKCYFGAKPSFERLKPRVSKYETMFGPGAIVWLRGYGEALATQLGPSVLCLDGRKLQPPKQTTPKTTPKPPEKKPLGTYVLKPKNPNTIGHFIGRKGKNIKILQSVFPNVSFKVETGVVCIEPKVWPVSSELMHLTRNAAHASSEFIQKIDAWLDGSLNKFVPILYLRSVYSI